MSDITDCSPNQFNLSRRDQWDRLYQLYKITEARELDGKRSWEPRSYSQLFEAHRGRTIIRNLDPAPREFFGGKRAAGANEERTISVTGGRITERTSKHMGAGRMTAFGQNNNPSQYSCCSGLVVSQ